MAPSRQSHDDRQLWADWGRVHGPAVRGYLAAMLGRPDLADDLAQEVLCRAWQARGRYREQGNARAYLLRIADRLACDHGRKLAREVNWSDQRWQAMEPADDLAEPGENLVREEAVRQLASALETLSPAQRRVLLLRYYGDLSFAQIAAIMGCPLSTALSHCHRGLAALRKLLVKSDL